MLMTRYSVKNKNLVPWVKFIWHFDSKNVNIHHKLLPTDCIDIVLSLSNNMIYESGTHKIIASPIHINGLRNKHSYIYQKGASHVFGISFYSYGMFPFVHKSLTSIQNEIVDLQILAPLLAKKLELVSYWDTLEHTIAFIESALCSQLQIHDEDMYKTTLIKDFLQANNNTNVQSFCTKNNIKIKTFERMVLHYTGYTPKVLHRIKRFQYASNQLVQQTKTTLSNIAYDNRFTDQAHFTKEFREFAGTAPLTFKQEKITVKENSKYSYI